MSCCIVTIDLDWSCEASIEQTLDFFHTKHIPVTVFTTHHSKIIDQLFYTLDIGLHPYFGEDSSHGSTIAKVVEYVMDLPHNMAAFRCHRFASCNASKQAMQAEGMLLSSNMCTDLEMISPFRDRFGLLEVPIFLEDGGYLWNKHPLNMHAKLKNALQAEDIKVLLIHPMHFVLNTPHFNYMYEIKQSMSRSQWTHRTGQQLNALRWKGDGIRNLIIDVINHTDAFSSLRYFLKN